eukprot:11173799-Lingulodinium_polyedra.AAC.1
MPEELLIICSVNMHYLYDAGVQAALQQVVLVSKVRATVALKEGSSLRQFVQVLRSYVQPLPASTWSA